MDFLLASDAGQWELSAELNVTGTSCPQDLQFGAKTQKRTMGNTLLDQPLVSGTWVREDRGTSLSCCAVLPTSSSQGRSCSLTAAKHGPRVWQPRAGRSRHCHRNHGPALSSGAKAAVPYPSPEFHMETRIHGCHCSPTSSHK